ncbi:MAG: YozE family protein [Oenococcus oeni]
MRSRGFYEWLMTQRKPENADEVQEFANAAFFDSEFPKQSQNFDEISKYLEENAPYLMSMKVFDEAWRRFLASEEEL